MSTYKTTRCGTRDFFGRMNGTSKSNIQNNEFFQLYARI